MNNAIDYVVSQLQDAPHLRVLLLVARGMQLTATALVRDRLAHSHSIEQALPTRLRLQFKVDWRQHHRDCSFQASCKGDALVGSRFDCIVVAEDVGDIDARWWRSSALARLPSGGELLDLRPRPLLGGSGEQAR